MNDNVKITQSSGNIFDDLDCQEAARALDEYQSNGGRTWEHFKRELDAIENGRNILQFPKLSKA